MYVLILQKGAEGKQNKSAGGGKPQRCEYQHKNKNTRQGRHFRHRINTAEADARKARLGDGRGKKGEKQCRKKPERAGGNAMCTAEETLYCFTRRVFAAETALLEQGRFLSFLGTARRLVLFVGRRCGGVGKPMPAVRAKFVIVAAGSSARGAERIFRFLPAIFAAHFFIPPLRKK